VKSGSTFELFGGTLLSRAEKKNTGARKKTGTHSGDGRARKNPDGQKPAGHSGRALGNTPDLPPIARLILALRAEKIRFQIAGMSAAILQGTPATTLDTDIWIDLPERQYVKVLNLCTKIGAEILAQTVVALEDGSLVNFLYRIDGLASFQTEWRRSNRLQWMGSEVAVLPLERILKSKKVIGRPKDLAHIPLLEQTIEAKKQGR
jgi:hypothetical protein